MPTTKTGRDLNDDDFERMADEAEQGIDVSGWNVEKVADRFGFDVEYPPDGPQTPAARNLLDHWEDEGGPDPEMVAALVQIEKEARSLGARTDRAAIAATLDMDFSVLAMTDQPLLPVEDDGYHEHTGVPCRTCVAMGLPARSTPAEATVIRIHHGDPDSHARSFNQGWDEALRDAIEDIPEGNNDGWTRYDTDDTHVLSVYANGETWDVIAPKRATPENKEPSDG